MSKADGKCTRQEEPKQKTLRPEHRMGIVGTEGPRVEGHSPLSMVGVEKDTGRLWIPL